MTKQPQDAGYYVRNDVTFCVCLYLGWHMCVFVCFHHLISFWTGQSLVSWQSTVTLFSDVSRWSDQTYETAMTLRGMPSMSSNSSQMSMHLNAFLHAPYLPSCHGLLLVLVFLVDPKRI